MRFVDLHGDKEEHYEEVTEYAMSGKRTASL